MATEAPKHYPGELATPAQVLSLADAYRDAAKLLLPMGRRGKPLSWAPYRLTAIHAIELYLNALLLHRGHNASDLRGLQHNLATRTERVVAAGLVLKKLTAAHLKSMAGNREYLVTRYGPEMTGNASQINRLAATLKEVAEKVTAALTSNGSAGRPSGSRPSPG